ncbi:MAG TPA: PAS domain-containing sensor histidine kinase [Candidatus Lokiarchaeia archaeon]|nr:PAS domain-containing sensor histidine kinase [Candidatus Lokiarchaeia archaeon]
MPKVVQPDSLKRDLQMEINRRKRVEDELKVETERRKQAEEKLETLKAQFHTIVEMQPDLITHYSVDGTVLYVNKANCDFFGLTLEEFSGHSFATFIPEEDRDAGMEVATSVSAQNPVVINRHRVINGAGEIRWTEWVNRGIFDEGGNLLEVVGVGRDVTEQVQAKRALEESHQFLDSVFENMPAIAFIVDAHTLKFERVNRFARELFSGESGTIVGKNVNDVFPRSFSAFFFNQIRKAADAVEIPEISLETPGLGTRTFSAKIIPLLDPGEQPRAYLGIAEDITEKNRIEAESKRILQQTIELNNLKSNILTLASHELKTPLTSILGWADLMFKKYNAGESLDEFVDGDILSSILRNANRISDLVDAYLDVGRIESDRLQISPQPTNAQDIVAISIQAVDPLARQKSMRIEVEGESQVISVDPLRFEQVLTQILTNAINYSPVNSAITVLMEVRKDKNQNFFEIRVSDEGYGFTTEELAVATEAFTNIHPTREEKANVKSTGLGLYISKNIIEKHGGTLEISSGGPSLGSTVTISIPLDPN